MTATHFYREPAYVEAVQVDVGQPVELYQDFLPPRWSARLHHIESSGCTVIKVRGPMNERGESRGFVANDGDWLTLEDGLVWRWPAVLFHAMHDHART